MKRGEVWWAGLAAPRGSEPGYRRPVLIVQSDPFNQSRIRTVVVAVVTSNLKLGAAPGNVVLKKRRSHLPKNSVVNVSQLLTLDRSFLIRCVSSLSAKVMSEVDEGLRKVMGL